MLARFPDELGTENTATAGKTAKTTKQKKKKKQNNNKTQTRINKTTKAESRSFRARAYPGKGKSAKPRKELHIK